MRLVYGALDVPRTQAWKMPLSHPDVVIVFQVWLYVATPASVGLAVNTGDEKVAQPLRNGFVAVPPPSSVIVPSSGMTVVVTCAPLAANCGENVYEIVLVAVPLFGRLSVPIDMLKSGTVFTVPS